MLLVIIVLIGWIIINRASENGWSIGDFSHNSDTMVSDGEQSGTDNTDSSDGPEQWQKEGAPYIDVELLTPNEYSRPQIPIESVQYIAIHYTANPGATAIENRNYFENLATTHDTKVSSHFVVGLDGEVVQCIPTSEMSYATNSRNVDTLSIECCHPDETGKFNEATYDSAVKLSAWLCVRFGLTSENVIRHYDVTGKNCPKYYVENPDAWIQMKSDIAAQIDVDYGLPGCSVKRKFSTVQKKFALKSTKKYCTIITTCDFFHDSACMTGGSRITYRECSEYMSRPPGQPGNYSMNK